MVYLSPHNEWVVEPEQKYVLAQDMLLMFSPGLIPPIRLCLFTFIHILPTMSPELYVTHNRSTALAEYLYIRGRETDFMTHKDLSRKCVSKNSA